MVERTSNQPPYESLKMLFRGAKEILTMTGHSISYYISQPHHISGVYFAEVGYALRGVADYNFVQRSCRNVAYAQTGTPNIHTVRSVFLRAVPLRYRRFLYIYSCIE